MRSAAREIDAVVPDGSLERDWLDASALVPFLACEPDARYPIQVLGRSAAALRDRLAELRPDLTIRAIALSGSGAVDPPAADVILTSLRDLPDALMPRSRTVVLDPQLGHAIAADAPLLEKVALRTVGWLLLPLFTRPVPYQLFYSEEFSFEEPLFNDAAESRWCWCTSRRPATIFAYAGRGVEIERLSFILAGANPGTFTCRVGEQMRAATTSIDAPSVSMSFSPLGFAGLVPIEITFDGEPLRPDRPEDPRKELHFSVGEVQLVRAPGHGALGWIDDPVAPRPLSDREVRRRLHVGFFEVEALGSPWRGLAGTVGIRSCFDYQSGFSFRDLGDPDRTVEICRPAARYDVPALWYRASKTPFPGSEWTRPVDRLWSAVHEGRRGSRSEREPGQG